MKSIFEISSNRRLQAEAGQLLGVLSLYKGDFAVAKNYFEKAIAIDKNLASAWVGIAEIEYLTLGKDPINFSNNIIHIFRNIERATQINPNQTTAYLLAGKTLLLVGDKKQARAFWKKPLRKLVKTSLLVLRKKKVY
mgnify:CR=1 FL=1